MNILKSELFKSIILELIRSTMTLFFGYISFKLFQRYKNKKDNTKLYIKIIKLEKELTQNKDKIQYILNKYTDREFLKKQFYINGSYSDKLYKLYSSIGELEIYYSEDPIWDEYGNRVGTEYNYAKAPYELMQQTGFEINCYENNNSNYSDIVKLKERLAYYESKYLYDDFYKIEKELIVFLEQDFILNEPIKFLYSKLKKFNNLSEDNKNKYFNKFCKFILEEENQFTTSLEDLKKLKSLNSELDSNEGSKLKMDFKLWQSIDIDLLAIYDAEIYLVLDELYSNLNDLEININDKEKLKDILNTSINKLENIIIKEKNKLNKSLSKTNKLFNGL